MQPHRLAAAALLPLLMAPAAWAASSDDEQRRREVTVLLRSLEGEPLGSAVVLEAAESGYWLATSRHVVEERSRLCVVNPNGVAEAAWVVPLTGRKPRSELDLAFLWLPEPQDQSLPAQRRPVVAFADPQPSATDFPVVIANGYPSPVQPGESRAEYREAKGLLLPLLRQPLQGGFTLSSTAAVQKGMSGGGVFVGSRLIGINGTHADPLWPGVTASESGKPLDEALNQRLELVSLALPAPVIRQALRTAAVPTKQQLAALATERCGW
jgi:hypothetical protein